MALALALQTLLAQAMGNRSVIDLVPVTVIYFALGAGPAAGILIGSLAGLAQDALSGGILGVGGFARCLVGFAAGAIGSQFIVTSTLPRFVVFVAGRPCRPGVSSASISMIDPQGFRVAPATVVAQALLNGVAGVLAFYVVERDPAGARTAAVAAGPRPQPAVELRKIGCCHEGRGRPPSSAGAARRVASRGDRAPSRCSRRCFWYLQVVQHRKFREMAENNHQRTLALRAPRGTLFDRDGRVLVENRDAFNISLVREQTRDLDRTLTAGRRIRGRRTGRNSTTSSSRHAREPRYRPVVLVSDATLAQVSAVLARRLELPDLLVEQVPTRQYPTNEMAAHLFGYVGEVTEQQLAREEYAALSAGSVIGQSGVEQVYNAKLMGADGARRVVVNSVGREIETLGERAPTEGTRLQLTIDSDLQRAVEDGFKATGYWGAAVVMDPRNGEVLSLVSLPAYDPTTSRRASTGRRGRS